VAKSEYASSSIELYCSNGKYEASRSLFYLESLFCSRMKLTTALYVLFVDY